MLQQFPQEILFIIYEHLNFYTKLNLARTCHKLKYSLYNTVLYQYISVSQRHARKLMTRFRDGTLDGSRVKSCCLGRGQFEAEILFQLPIIFPNLKQLTFRHRKALYLGDIAAVYGLRTRLEMCGRYVGDCAFVLLPLYVFPALRHLVLNASCYHQQQQQGWKYLENVPNLESLALCEFHIDVVFLESLHRHATKLKKLVMLDAQLHFNEIRNPNSIEAAPHLNDFQMRTVNDFCDGNSHLIQYLILKYPNIKSLQLYNRDSLIVPQRNETFLESLKQLIGQLDELKINFYLMEKPLTAITHLVGRDFGMIFPDLLYIGNHQRLIRQLYREVTRLSLPTVYLPHIYHRGSHLPHIKELRLFSPGFPPVGDACIRLDELLLTYSGLETLDIHCEYTKVTARTGGTISSPLRHLKLMVLTINRATLDFLYESLPNLTELYLGTRQKQRSFQLILPEHTLQTLSLNLFWPDHDKKRWKLIYSIRTEDGLKKFKYLHRGRDNVRVTEKGGMDLGYFKTGCVEIVCKRLFELKHENHSLI
ncbi:hypothetical protein K501DRAFT_277744 [Backusella circina FSU 941]|nr:hypothetical protein K501DRAFT_277744 [Backusella circina FSU 941]